MDKIGKYEIETPLLDTSFSDIFVARDPAQSGHFAIKVFHPKGDNVGENAKYGIDFWRARFIEEAKIMSRFDHPNLVKAVDTGETDDGAPYIVMPFMKANLLVEIGEDAATSRDIAKLAEKWRPRPLSPRRAVEIWRQVLSALRAMHDAGLVHRDIKPPNVLLDSMQGGQVKLCDFGMVKVPGAAGSRTGIWVGTLDYISPEQRRSAADVDARADVYSAAVLMYRMLAGRLPPLKLGQVKGSRFAVPDLLIELIRACMQPDCDSRPANAGEVLAALDEAIPDVMTLPGESIVPVRQPAARTLKAEIR